jgi:hypothetical protein
VGTETIPSSRRTPFVFPDSVFPDTVFPDTVFPDDEVVYPIP